MPATEAPCVELGSVPEPPSVVASPSASDISSASSPEPVNVRATPLFRALAMPPPEPVQPPGQEELERRLPGYRRIVIPRELTLIELLKQSTGAETDEEVLRVREARLRVIAERVGLRRLHVLAPRLRSLTLDGSALSSLRDLGIGLVHLKILSVKRCCLTSLDGVWGLGSLREFYASGNRLQDLQPLAALQKLHTLDLAQNPIAESNRLWTLGVCSSLRRLTLQGCPASDVPQYRSKVAAALPLLVYLDDCPLQMDTAYDSSEEIFGMPSSSESEASEVEDLELTLNTNSCTSEHVAGTSSDSRIVKAEQTIGIEGGYSVLGGVEADQGKVSERRRRPATTEAAGVRPRASVPARPRTAHDAVAPSRLEIYNTLLDGEWRCSGSNLTSCAAVCGNLARALRRPSTASRRTAVEEPLDVEVGDDMLQSAARALAAEIPHLPTKENWDKFRLETGIEIDLDFNERPRSADPAKVMEKLEQIERETCERYRQDTLKQYKSIAGPSPSLQDDQSSITRQPDISTYTANDILALDFDAWRNIERLEPNIDDSQDVDVPVERGDRSERKMLRRLNNM